MNGVTLMQLKIKVTEKGIRYLGYYTKWGEGMLGALGGIIALIAYAARFKSPRMYESFLQNVNGSEMLYFISNISSVVLGILFYKYGKALLNKESSSRQKIINLFFIAYSLILGINFLSIGFQTVMTPQILFPFFIVGSIFAILRTDEAKAILNK